MKIVSEKILFLRKKDGLSQEKLSEVIGVSRQTVSKWETGNVVPDMVHIIALCNYFNVDITYFVCDEVCATISDEQATSSESENIIAKETTASHRILKRIKALLICLSIITLIFVSITIFSGLIVFSVPSNSSVETIYFSDIDLSILDVFVISVIISIVFIVSIIVISIIMAKYKKQINSKGD